MTATLLAIDAICILIGVLLSAYISAACVMTMRREGVTGPVLALMLLRLSFILLLVVNLTETAIMDVGSERFVDFFLLVKIIAISIFNAVTVFYILEMWLQTKQPR